MTTHNYFLNPRDLLFLRDARPMEASDPGLGANLPRPDQIWNAFIHAFHQEWPQHQPWEHRHTLRESDKNQETSARFGALKTAGPFLTKNGEMFFPCPLDLSADNQGMLYHMRPKRLSGTNLPPPLAYGYASSRIGKQETPSWISEKDYGAYLQGIPFQPSQAELFDTERQLGIGIEGETHAVMKGKIYQAEYLRLREDVSLAVSVSCSIMGSDRSQPVDVFSKFKTADQSIILGGQQGLVYLKEGRPLAWPNSPPFPMKPGKGPLRLRWTLLSPAIFPAIREDVDGGIKAHAGGWLPSWVDAQTGMVMLPTSPPERMPGERREDWRSRIKAAPPSQCRLVAARIGKPVAFSGWDLQTGPKPTCLAVPAGSVYLFECPDAREAADLAAILSWNGHQGNEIKNRRSTLFGEKGFGLGVCSWCVENEESS